MYSLDTKYFEYIAVSFYTEPQFDGNWRLQRSYLANFSLHNYYVDYDSKGKENAFTDYGIRQTFVFFDLV